MWWWQNSSALPFYHTSRLLEDESHFCIKLRRKSYAYERYKYAYSFSWKISMTGHKIVAGADSLKSSQPLVNRRVCNENKAMICRVTAPGKF